MQSATKQDREAFGARLAALANAHDLLTSENWDQASLRTVVERAISLFEQKKRHRFSIVGPEVVLSPSKALMLTLTLHELATNAVKYGSLSNGRGRVTINWQASSASNVKLGWKETGGPPVTPPKNKGFGSLVIEHSLEGQHGGAVFKFDPRGLVCTLEIER